MPNGRPATERPKTGFASFLENPVFRAWALGLFAVLATFLFYLPTLSFGFVNLDDPQVVQNNPMIRNRSLYGLGLMFTTFHNADWMPFTWLSLSLDDLIGGAKPWIYHLTNDILHALNTAWVFLLVRSLLGLARKPGDAPAGPRPAWEDGAAFLSALLFGLHPLHVESVAWVTERKDVLYGFFYLASLQAYLAYATAKDHPALRYSLCFFLFLCSCMSKTAAVTLPVVLLLLDHWPLERSAKGWVRLVLEKVPFFLFALLTGILSIQSHEGGPVQLPLAQVILKPLFAFFFYLWKAVVPYGLSPLHPTIPLVFPAYVWGTSALGVLLLAATWAFFRYRKEKPGLLTAFLFYVVTMAPNLAILIKGGHEGTGAADHYTYLPLLGFFIPLCVWAAKGLQRLPWILAAVALGLTAWLGTLTLAQASIWKDTDSLWYGAAKVYPYSTLVRLELGNLALSHGELKEAEACFRYVQQAQPGLPSAYVGLALAELKQGRTGEAILNFRKATSLNANDPKIWIFLWKALTQEERHQEALDEVKAAAAKDPDWDMLWNLMGSSYGYLGKQEEAVRSFQKALRLSPGNPEYLLNLGDTYLFFGKKAQAGDSYRQALAASPGSADTLCSVGESYSRMKMAKEGLPYLEKAWALEQSPRVAADLARTYKLLGQKSKADEFARLFRSMNASGSPR